MHIPGSESTLKNRWYSDGDVAGPLSTNCTLYVAPARMSQIVLKLEMTNLLKYPTARGRSQSEPTANQLFRLPHSCMERATSPSHPELPNELTGGTLSPGIYIHQLLTSSVPF